MLRKLQLLVMTFGLGLMAWPGAAMAEVEGRSTPWQINLQDAHSPVMEQVHDFHNLLLVIQFAIVALVLGILAYVVVRFNKKRNPVPSKTSHNTMLEVIWTAVPIVILVIIAIPGLRLLYYSDKVQEVDMTLKVVGHQWYWSYHYPDHGDFQFDSFLVPEDELKEGQPRLLAVDNPVVLPVNTNVQVVISSDDVIHDWAVPSLGMKVDATPGRLNERWLRIDQEGTYYGMCSELCGVNHGFMPIEIRAVSKDAFDAWVTQAKEQFARNDEPGARVAEAPNQAKSK